jgi:ABC-type lipoprotein release transport system permease subunit
MNDFLWFAWKKGYRTISKNKSKTIPIIVLMTFAIFYGGLMFNYQDIREGIVDEAVDATNFADGFIYTETINQSISDNLMKSIEDIESYEFRLILRATFTIESEEYDGIIVGIDPSIKEHICTLVDKNKKELDSLENCINWDFADRNDIKKGDKIKVELGEGKKKCEIEDIGFSPEFSYSNLYEDIPYPSIRAFPVFYMDILEVTTHFINQNASMPMTNNIVYQIESKADIDDVEDNIEDVFRTYLIQHIKQYDQSYIAFFREDKEADERTMMIMQGLIIVGTIITLGIIVSKLVEEDLKNISVFQGLGAEKSEIITSYIIFNLLISAISLAIGTILVGITGPSVNQFFAYMMRIPFKIDPYFAINNILTLGFIMLGTSLFVTLAIVAKSFKMNVQETLKYETQFLNKTNIIEKFISNFRGKALKPFTKYNLRRVFGKKSSLFTLIFSLAFAFSFIFIAMGFQDSVNYSVDKKLNEVERWDGLAKTWNYQNESYLDDLMEDLDRVDEFEFGISETLTLKNKKNGEDTTVLMMAFEDDSKLHILETENEVERENDKEIYVSKDMISKGIVSMGQEVKIKTVGGNKSYRVRVIASVNDMSSKTIYLSMEKAQRVVGENDRVNLIYFTTNVDIDKVAEDVEELDVVKRVMLKEKLQEEFTAFLQIFMAFIMIMGSFFVGFALVMTVVTMNSIFEYRTEDYARMKAFGVFHKEIRRSIIKETIFYIITTFIFGSLLGIFLTYYLITQTVLSSGLYFYAYPSTYIISSILSSIVMGIIVLVQLRKIKRMNIAEVTRMKTFG